jgi:hypothetical protein
MADSRTRFVSLAILLLAIFPTTWLVCSHLDVPQFGYYQDDGLLFLNAKSLSAGNGFRIPSLPGQPHQTKYQPLLPLLEAVIWKIDAHFPSNLREVALLQLAFFLSFVVICNAFFRWGGFSRVEGAGLSAFLGLSPLVVYWATIPTADYLFAALTIAVFLALRRVGPAAAGALTAAAFLTKSAGMLIIPAVLLALFRKRDWPGIARFLALASPAVILWMVWASMNKPSVGHHVLAYYTDYFGYYLQSGGLNALSDIVSANLLSLCGAAGSLLMNGMSDSVGGRFLSILVAAATVTGGVRFARQTGSVEYPIFCGLLTAVFCIWNFSPNVRLMLPIAPLVAIGLYGEAQKFATLSKQAFKGTAGNRGVAWVLMAALLAGTFYAVQTNFMFIQQTIPQLMAQGRTNNRELGAIYTWMSAKLPRESVVMASGDTLVYLNTGLRSVKPVPNSVAFYRNDRAGIFENFRQPESLERAFGITHILLTPADRSPDFDPPDQREANRLMRDNPRHRLIYEEKGYQILEVKASPSPAARTSGSS